MQSKHPYPWFFFLRVIRLSFLVFLPTLIIILFVYRSSYQEGLVSQLRTQIQSELKTIKFTLGQGRLSPLSWCQGLPTESDVRYSVIDSSGVIRCDTSKFKVGAELKTAPEVDEARKTGFALEIRDSDYFKTPSAFGAIRFDDGTILRQTVPISALKNDLGRFDRLLFFRIVPFALLSYLFFIYLFYNATRPLGMILSMVEKYKSDIPFTKSLKLLYDKDRWGEIEEALARADQRINFQVNEARKENEKNAAILESINDDIIAIDPFETILFYNSKFKANFIQERSNAELVPKIWQTFKDEAVLQAFRSVLKNGERVTLKAVGQLSHRHPDRFFDVTVTPLKGTDGKISGALAVLYDVTDFKLTEQMRVDFVANVSHEIRTPLTSVKGYAQILQQQKSKVDESLQPFLDKIIVNSERMIRLFNDLLNLSVIESKYSLVKTEIQLESFIEDISDSIRTNYPDKSFKLDLDLKLDHIFADPKLMEQVLTNLIDNAFKYSERQDIRVQISCSKHGDKALLNISDNGPGISREHLQRIFERFYRVDSSRETSRGTGLGLSIVKHIIVKHAGRIWADSSENHGTTFSIELPLE